MAPNICHINEDMFGVCHRKRSVLLSDHSMIANQRLKKLLISHPMMNTYYSLFRFHVFHNAKSHSTTGNIFESIIQLIK